ncbi:MAG: CRTAC1 family protein [Acidobacteriaceae bacterium]
MSNKALTPRPARAILLAACAALLALPGTSPAAQTKQPPKWPQVLHSTNVSGNAAIAFENILRRSKINFELHNSSEPHQYSIETMLGGVAVFDYNNDGLPDIFFTNGAAIPSLKKTGPEYWNRLYRNNGDGTFSDVTRQAGLEGVGYSMGVAVGDYNNDGYEDLYVVGVNKNQLFRNNGNGTFTDVTRQAGVSGVIPGVGKPWAVAAGWFDYNNDGYLDLFVVNYLDYNIKTARECRVRGIPAYCSPNDFQGTEDILYRNNGNGTFTNVSKQSRIAEYVGKGMGLAFGDFNHDGYTDVFISNDTYPNFLFRNNGDGTFINVAMQAGVAYTDSGKTVAGMGADFRDLDNDGKPDIFQTAMFGDTFPLYHNLGGGQFENATSHAGLTTLTSRLTGWGTGAYDFDNDGRKDLFIAGSAILDNAPKVEHRPYNLPDRVYRNLGHLTFEDVSAAAGLEFAAAHRGGAFGDLNNDGKIDAVVNVINGPPEILINRTRNHNHWITLRLIGVKSNRDGIGTRIEVITAHGAQYNEATTAVGYNSSSSRRVHFGLGPDAAIQKVILHWPSGITQMLTNVKADQFLTVTESAK